MRKLRGIITIALSLVLVMTMMFSLSGIFGMAGSPSIVALGSDGGSTGSDGGSADSGGGKDTCDPYDISCATVSVADAVYTGSALKPAVTVKANGKTLSSAAYSLSYSNNTGAGKGTVVVTGKSPYYGKKSKTFTISKAANKMKASGNKVTVKYSKLKKKNQTVKASKAFDVSNAKGKVTYKKKSGNSKITVSSSGKVTVKKKLKKGSYKIKVKINAAGTSNYESKSKTVTLTVKVK